MMRFIDKLKTRIGVGRNGEQSTPVVVDVGSFRSSIGRNAEHGVAVFMKRFAAFAEQEHCPLTLVLPADMAQAATHGNLNTVVIPGDGSCADVVRKALKNSDSGAVPVVVTADDEVARQAEAAGADVMRPMTFFKSLPILPHPHPNPQRPVQQQRRDFQRSQQRNERPPAREHQPPAPDSQNGAHTPAPAQSQQAPAAGAQPKTIMDLIDPL